ncbi:hypothetical protein MP228_012704 [Amoeboaphelidium protococcarum]|nr:hypothetical protein MP228_012704 [Amoeboaphelidium protococcarum]
MDQIRLLHQEIDVLEEKIGALVGSKWKTWRERILKETVISKFLNSIKQKSLRLLELYEDLQQQLNGNGELPDFDQQLAHLQQIKYDYNRNGGIVQLAQEFRVHIDWQKEFELLGQQFDEMEIYGKYVNLRPVYDQYLSLDVAQPEGGVQYVQFISDCDQIIKGINIKDQQKVDVEYKKFIQMFHDYLTGFLNKSRPLLDINSVLVDRDNQDFQDGIQKQVDSINFSLDLYCFACAKDFSKQSVYDGHLKGKKHQRNEKQLLMDNSKEELDMLRSIECKKRQADFRLILMMESDVLQMLEYLKDVRDRTITFLERKQTLTFDELANMIEEELNEQVDLSSPSSAYFQLYNGFGSDDDHDGENNHDKQDMDHQHDFYNPLKLPLGWDGKPIPFWLWKLHGLRQEFPCEICGGYVYMGRRAFERHFQDWRHSHGMRCLGLPNNAQFHEITKIADAFALWNKIKSSELSADFKADELEEFEDQYGNVFNKKVYQDLKRQGLL